MPEHILHIRTPLLDLAYEAGGPEEGPPVFLLHGWPDDVRTYDAVKPVLHAAGFRTYVPWLRGFGPTRFRSASTPRSGQIAAMARDILDFADELAINRVRIVGHDWGARIAYFLAAIEPVRIERMVTMSAGWDPGPWKTPALPQARNFWYQWFMCTDRGGEAVRHHGKDFARFLWQTWSPRAWFDESSFAVTAGSFDNPDWPNITLHSYRVRWGEVDPDPHYIDLELQQQGVTEISIPTLLIHGADDQCVAASTSEGKEGNFTGGYRRCVLPSVGHFPTREAAATVAELIVEFLQESA